MMVIWEYGNIVWWNECLELFLWKVRIGLFWTIIWYRNMSDNLLIIVCSRRGFFSETGIVICQVMRYDRLQAVRRRLILMLIVMLINGTRSPRTWKEVAFFGQNHAVVWSVNKKGIFFRRLLLIILIDGKSKQKSQLNQKSRIFPEKVLFHGDITYEIEFYFWLIYETKLRTWSIYEIQLEN